MKLFIKNMVCIRCKMVVKSELEKLGLCYSYVEIGEVEIDDTSTKEQLNLLSIALKLDGLELMVNKKNILVDRINTLIIEHVHFSDDQRKVNLSDHLSAELGYNYTYLANLFSEANGITIESFYLSQKIEEVKELLILGKQNLTEIAFKLNYSSVAHLSNQFKKMTGLTPSLFKSLKLKQPSTIGSS